MRYLLAPGNTLIIQGPASFRLLSGDATILGSPLTSECKIVVRCEKQLPIEALSEVDLEILMGKFGKMSEVEGNTIPKSWTLAVDSLTEMREGKVMVIGATDVGKSTLCTYLTNGLLSRDLSARLVDADIGQADIGPPTTISRAFPRDYVSSLSDLAPEAMVFIGHTSPSKVEPKLIEGMRRLLDSLGGSLTIINTDGWVLDPEATAYKLGLIAEIEPDLVIGISTGAELEPILSASHARSIKVEASRAILTRSRNNRREIRNAAYRKFLEGGTARTLSMKNFRITIPKELPPLQGMRSQDMANVIVGLLDERRYMCQIGVLLDLQEGFLRIYSRQVEGVREIELGYVKLSTDGTELGYLET